MSPGEAFRTVLDMSHKRAGTDLPMSYEARVSWKSPTTDPDETFNETYTVDFRRFYAQREWNLVDQQPQKLLNALDGIASAIDRLADDGDARPPSIEDTLGLCQVSKALGSEEE